MLVQLLLLEFILLPGEITRNIGFSTLLAGSGLLCLLEIAGLLIWTDRRPHGWLLRNLRNTREKRLQRLCHKKTVCYV